MKAVLLYAYGDPDQLRYEETAGPFRAWWAVQDSNLRPPACKAGALTN
jgi:hypothetical protein